MNRTELEQRLRELVMDNVFVDCRSSSVGCLEFVGGVDDLVKALADFHENQLEQENQMFKKVF